MRCGQCGSEHNGIGNICSDCRWINKQSIPRKYEYVIQVRKIDQYIDVSIETSEGRARVQFESMKRIYSDYFMRMIKIVTKGYKGNRTVKKYIIGRHRPPYSDTEYDDVDMMR